MRVGSIVFYDLEIVHPPMPVQGFPLVTPCKGWRDFEGMGISCVGFALGRQSPNCHEWPSQGFNDLVAAGYQIVGFNSRAFDDNLLKANHVQVNSVDFLDMIRLSAFGSTNWKDQPYGYSYRLDNLAKANLDFSKSGTGVLAPVLWQQGRKAEVMSYCADDVRILQSLFFRFIEGELIDPNTGKRLAPAYLAA